MLQQPRDCLATDILRPSARRRGLPIVRRHDAINPPAIGAVAQIRPIAQLLGHPLGMLNDRAAHIDHVQGA
ncbi:MAG TPA: hypothetical protein VF175_18105, partial [Lacipirellula sp.]